VSGISVHSSEYVSFIISPTRAALAAKVGQIHTTTIIVTTTTTTTTTTSCSSSSSNSDCGSTIVGLIVILAV
jgi:hypothetical protein